MSMATILPYIQILLSIILIGGILIQRSDASLGSAFGGDSFGSTQFERRGAEKTLFRLTIVIGVLFAISSFIALIVL